MRWKDLASSELKLLLAQKGISYGDLVSLLKKNGVKETYASVSNKVSRGTFSFAFYLQCLKALNVQLSIPGAHTTTIANSPANLDLRQVSQLPGGGQAQQGPKGSPRKIQQLPSKPFIRRIHADARQIPLPDASVDVVVTSPPYWKKRDYSFDGQLGQEKTPQGYVASMMSCLEEWRRLLPSWGSVFINVGDTYSQRSLASVPSRLEVAALDAGWILRNRIIWAKEGGMPEPAKNRLANRHEHILHLVKKDDYYSDVVGYAQKFGNGSSPGDVWSISLRRNMSGHLAPFPEELVDRVVTLACPPQVCTKCGQPRRRIVKRTAELDATRPQARRAMQLAKEKGLTAAHIEAIQATGISDAGKALRVQTGTGKNSERVKRLAQEAKDALGGYFREFTFPKKRTVGWSACECGAPFRAGIVLDPFMGTGTALRVAGSLGLSAVGVDLAPQNDVDVWGAKADVRSGGGSRAVSDRASSAASAAYASEPEDT